MYSRNMVNHFGADNISRACLNFSTDFENTVIRIKTSLGAITFAASLLAIFLILISKKYKDATFRLVIYLMITDILQAVAMCLALSPITVPSDVLPAEVKDSTVWKDLCEATGFLLMTTMWMGNIVIFWIVIHLLVLGWRLYRLQVTAAADASENATTPNSSQCKMNWEIVGLLFLIIAPFVISAIPFSLPNHMYGSAGLWCWIKMVNNDSCNNPEFAKEAIMVPLVFFYGPLLLIVFFSLISMFATIVLVCCGAVRRSGRRVVDKHQRRMKEIMLVLAYPLLYCTVCLVLLTNRIYTITNSGNQRTPYFPLWIAHTIADPVRVLLPAIAFLFHPYVWRDLCAHSTTTEGQEDPNQCNNINGDENSNEENSMEDKLLMTQDSGGNKHNYGGCDDNRNLSLLVESK